MVPIDDFINNIIQPNFIEEVKQDGDAFEDLEGGDATAMHFR